MRRILIDHARARLAGKRGGKQGLFLTAEAQLGVPPLQPLYWHIYEYTSRAAAEAA